MRSLTEMHRFGASPSASHINASMMDKALLWKIHVIPITDSPRWVMENHPSVVIYG